MITLYQTDRLESNEILKRHFCENTEETVDFYTPDCMFIAGEYSRMCTNGKIISESIINCPDPLKTPEVIKRYTRLIRDGTGEFATREIGEKMGSLAFLNLIEDEDEAINNVIALGYR